MLMFLSFNTAMSQTSTTSKLEPEAPITPWIDHVKHIAEIASIEWKDNGMGYATITLPFSLTNAVSIDNQISMVYSYKVTDKTIEFVFNSPTPKITKTTLNFEDENYTFGYINTPNGHEYIAFKWKYIIDINFKY